MKRSNQLVSPPRSLSLVVDLSHVTQLRLNLGNLPSRDRIRSDRLIDLLKETSSLQSLTLYWRIADEDDPSVVEKICSTIIDHLGRSKLRYLSIPIFNLDQIKIILDRFVDLFGLTLTLPTESITSAEIIDYFSTSWRNCSTLISYKSVSIWLDKRSNTSNNHKRMKLSH